VSSTGPVGVQESSNTYATLKCISYHVYSHHTQGTYDCQCHISTWPALMYSCCCYCALFPTGVLNRPCTYGVL
jgi:hypothetical protein